MILNIIPIYDKSLNILSPRLNSNQEEIEQIWEKLRIIKKTRAPKKKIKEERKENSVLKLQRKIP